MMFLTEVSMWSIVKKQFRFKLKAYRGMYTSLMMLQIIAILFSLNGEASTGGGGNHLHYNVSYYGGNMILIFMMIWAFISAILITTQAYRFDDYSFVANRLSSHLANILYLGFASVLAGVTVVLASQFLKVLVLILKDEANIVSAPLTIPQFSAGLIAMILYLFLFTALGYLSGMLIQKSKIFVVILPALFFGVIILQGFLAQEPTLMIDIGKFFGGEASFVLFTLKILILSSLAYGSAAWISNEMEVRQ